MAKLQIDFFSISTGINVNFDAFVTAFSDNYTVGWNEAEVFGRMDPIATYKGTRRSISCTFTIPAASDEEIVINHKKFQTLLSLMYPNYDVDPKTKNATIASVPLFKVKYANLIYDFSQSNNYLIQSAREAGQLGYFNSFKFDPNNDSQVLVKDGGVYYQSLNCTFEFKPLHTARLGRDAKDLLDVQNSNFGKSFPYGDSGTPISSSIDETPFVASLSDPKKFLAASDRDQTRYLETLTPPQRVAFQTEVNKTTSTQFKQLFLD